MTLQETSGIPTLETRRKSFCYFVFFRIGSNEPQRTSPITVTHPEAQKIRDRMIRAAHDRGRRLGDEELHPFVLASMAADAVAAEYRRQGYDAWTRIGRY